MITPEELAAALEIEDPTAQQLDRLEKLEEAAVAFVETQTGRYFGPPEEYTEQLAGRGVGSLWLSSRPVAGDGPLVVLEERSYPGSDPQPLVIDEDFGIVLHSDDAELVRFGGCLGWPRGYSYTATYRRGYAPGEEPADIRQLVIDLVAVRYSMAGREGLRSESVGGYSYTRFGDSDLDAVMGGSATIDIWRRPVVA